MQHIGFDGKFEDSFVLGGAGSPEAQTLQAQYLIHPSTICRGTRSSRWVVHTIFYQVGTNVIIVP